MLISNDGKTICSITESKIFLSPRQGRFENCQLRLWPYARQTEFPLASPSLLRHINKRTALSCHSMFDMYLPTPRHSFKLGSTVNGCGKRSALETHSDVGSGLAKRPAREFRGEEVLRRLRGFGSGYSLRAFQNLIGGKVHAQADLFRL